jgi:hypothetical protein
MDERELATGGRRAAIAAAWSAEPERFPCAWKIYSSAEAPFAGASIDAESETGAARR